MKLSHRLSHIVKMIPPQYEHIWDCCCDHGLLGAQILDQKLSTTTHFVDIVPELMQQVEHKLQLFYPLNTDTPPHWQVHCIDVAQLPLHQYQGRQLVIIAGVGGDLMLQMVQQLMNAHPSLSLDFLLCPVHHVAKLRAMLNASYCQLLDEQLICDNMRYYELLYISRPAADQINLTTDPLISLFGNKIWQTDCAEQSLIIKGYLNKLLTHYKKAAKSISAVDISVIEGYQHIADSLA
ncbi:tRNA (adenine(22)-N(1))-methyltransferase [Shewanella subflava]|uniref:tRNA (Adenine(22)-N(1))-methyltransferase TrmK n=1 Tax=Shewanella subflava TaxID=2986476 RepID=A0ABT3I580_9GAMM|nr:tRNA (adenine(22)-N(1))-methyltransferase TrmK [Shewanella subflava]MCW3171095.1 tRNA (adenine(22)-N(1))-methyltransferase TrmK [Shewanella subflava]